MASVRSEASPLGERFNLDSVIVGLAGDLDELRAGKITVDNARTRAELAKQIMNGVRLIINAQKYLELLPPSAALRARTATTGGEKP